MPLKPGDDEETVSENIREMVKAGHSQKQAVAAAMNKARDAESMPTSLPEMGPQVTTPTGGTGGPLGNITSKCGGDATPMGVETGRLQAPVTMGAQTQTAPSGLTTGIRTNQTVPEGPSR
jgi:hypothetical protein